MDQFDEVKLSDIIKDSLPKLLNRDTTAVTLSAGSSFPPDVDSSMLGRLCNRLDLHCIYALTSISPVTWTLVLDYSSEPALLSYVATNYQPLNVKLTALSNVETGTDKLPYFLNVNGEMSTIQLTSFGKSLLNGASAAAVRTLLGLGSLATKNKITGGDIEDGSITVDKLAFKPISLSDSFMTGDIKETFETTPPDGWIELTGSIGSAQSEATYADDSAENLFLLMWSNPGVTIEPSKGSTADGDWRSNKKLIFPATGTFNTGSIYIIKL